MPHGHGDGGGAGEEEGPGVTPCGDGRDKLWGSSGRAFTRVNRWCGVIKKHWFVNEAVMLIKLAFPLVRRLCMYV